MKIERAWLRIIVAVVAPFGAVFALCVGCAFVEYWGGKLAGRWYNLFAVIVFVATPCVAAMLTHLLTPKVMLDGHTRCGKCGYILKGLTEPRCSECGEQI